MVGSDLYFLLAWCVVKCPTQALFQNPKSSVGSILRNHGCTPDAMAVPEKTIPKMHCKCLIALVNKSQCVIFVYLFFKSVFWILHCLALCFSTWNVIKFTHNVLAILLHCLHESCIGCLILSQHCRHIGSGKTALLTHSSDFSGYKAQYITFLNWFQRFMINLYYKTFFLYYLLFTFFLRNCYAFLFLFTKANFIYS